MRPLKALASAAVFAAATALLLFAVSFVITVTMPPYRDSIGSVNHTEKITGRYLLRQSAAREDNLIIYGSSELATTEISTHPSNFFASKRTGFQVNLVGRGSCQSLIHAISIAASGDSLTGKKVALITSPQSFVPEGIAPDMFAANFSPGQYLELLAAEDISPEIKRAVSARVSELLVSYKAAPGSAGTDPAIRYLAGHHASPTAATAAANAALKPYYAFSRYLFDIRDKASARTLLKSSEEPEAPAMRAVIDWPEEERAAISQAREMTDNNDLGILNDYYTTYIGARLQRQQGKDSALDYSVSAEYGDLRLLFEVCRQKGIEPLFIHVPLHGQWSDYTGLTPDRRQAYYENVRKIVDEYAVEILDLAEYEYEEYFLCDVMHLGWKGWLEVDKALIDYYYDN